MRESLCLGIVVAVLAFGPAAPAQEASPLEKIQFGVSHAAIRSTLGKPFEVAKWGDGDHTADVGLPSGRWEVFHLSAPGDRMYAVILHFTPAGEEAAPSSTLDSLMIEPTGQITAVQALTDIPALAALCKASCDVLRTTDNAGRVSILLKPARADGASRVIYIETAGAATHRLEKVPLESRIEWVYTLPLKEFDNHHPNDSREAIAKWQP